MFQAPGSNIRIVRIDEDVVTSKKEPEYVLVPTEKNEVTERDIESGESYGDDDDAVVGDAKSRIR